jgi:hypothetical protein
MILREIMVTQCAGRTLHAPVIDKSNSVGGGFTESSPHFHE